MEIIDNRFISQLCKLEDDEPAVGPVEEKKTLSYCSTCLYIDILPCDGNYSL